MRQELKAMCVDVHMLRRWSDALMLMVLLSMSMDVFALICSGNGLSGWTDVMSTVSETVFLLSVSGLVLVFNSCPGVCQVVRVLCWVTAVLLWCSVLLVRVPLLMGEDFLSGVGMPISYMSMFLSTLWLVSLFAMFAVVSVQHAVRGFRTSMIGMTMMLAFTLLALVLLLLTLLSGDLGCWVYVAWTVVALLSMIPFWCVRRLVYKFSNESNDNEI